ncbi:hypothetical protein N184_09790 [Sinorhizobium sp. GL28]|nr:hypothetical protein N184_09790 [Sinorhizobium sp. GL28]
MLASISGRLGFLQWMNYLHEKILFETIFSSRYIDELPR